MIRIEKIIWLSKEAKEAEVVISDNKHKITCFSQPFLKSEGDLLKEPIYALDVNDLYKIDSSNFEIRSLGEFNYLIEGELVDKEQGLVKVEDFLIEIDSSFLPKDIDNNDFISFKCSRLDIW